MSGNLKKSRAPVYIFVKTQFYDVYFYCKSIQLLYMYRCIPGQKCDSVTRHTD